MDRTLSPPRTHVLHRRQVLASAVGAGLVTSAGLLPYTAGPAAARESTGGVSMQRGYAPGPYGQVHYIDAGQGIPLVMCHQAPMSLRQFDRVYEPLARLGLRPIGVDTPGFGTSEAPDFVPTVEDYAKAIPSVLDHLGIGRAFVLGHHTGALIATEVALQFPDRVIALIVHGPLPLTPERRAQGLAYVEEFEKGLVHRPDGQHLTTMFNNRMIYANEDTDWQHASRYIAEQLIGLGPFWYGHHAAFQYDHEPALMRVRHPTLILTNTGDSIYDLAQQVRQMRPDFDYAEIEGGSIDIVDEKPEEWAAQVNAFVQKISAGED